MEIAWVTVTTAGRWEEIKALISPTYPIVHASDKARPAQHSRSSLNRDQRREKETGLAEWESICERNICALINHC